MGPPFSTDHPRSTDPLVDASWGGRLDDVRDLLADGHDPNTRDDRDCSPLSAATRRDHVELMRALIDAGADPREVTGNAGSLLSIAASSGRLEATRLLLAAGADPNGPRLKDSHYTILMQAAGALRYYDPDANLAGRLALVRLLIDAGADVNAATSEGRTPLAATRGEDDLVQTLMEAGATLPPDRPGREPLLVAAMESYRLRPSREAGICRLIAAGAAVNSADEDGVTPLKRACAVGSGRVVAALLESGARRVGATSPDGDSRRPEPHLAASSGNPRVVRMLLHDGADPAEVDHAGRTPLYIASASGRGEALRVLLAAGADPNAGRDRGRSPPREASYRGHDACVAALLEAGADVDARTHGEVTALHLASLMRRLDVIPRLLRAGESVDARDADGRTPLMWALRTKAHSEKATKRIAKTVDLLLATGADPFAADHRGQSALFEAARSNQVGEIRRLLALGLDVNAPASDGSTPLMIAASEHDIDARSTAALLAGGADVNAVDRSGATVLHRMLRPQQPPDPRSYCWWTPFRLYAWPTLDHLLKPVPRSTAPTIKGSRRSCSPPRTRTQTSSPRCSRPVPTPKPVIGPEWMPRVTPRRSAANGSLGEIGRRP